jgi:hypothetical protein
MDDAEKILARLAEERAAHMERIQEIDDQAQQLVTDALQDLAKRSESLRTQFGHLLPKPGSQSRAMTPPRS